jgi:hypothetical protein
MIKRFLNYLTDVRDRQRIIIALTKGAAMMHARNIDLTRPATWEFSGFSQNGEDGILDVLRRQLRNSDRYFIEIGAADGIDNNTAWLVVAEKYSGLMIEANPRLVERAKRTIVGYSIGAECLSMFVTRENAKKLNPWRYTTIPMYLASTSMETTTTSRKRFSMPVCGQKSSLWNITRSTDPRKA